MAPLNYLRGVVDTKLYLVLDDVRTRIMSHYTHARTVPEAIAIIEKAVADGQPIAELWLDHDLGDGNQNGKALSYWLVERNFHGEKIPIEQVFIHSMNAMGSRHMFSDLSPLYETYMIAIEPSQWLVTGPGLE